MSLKSVLLGNMIGNPDEEDKEVKSVAQLGTAGFSHHTLSQNIFVTSNIIHWVLAIVTNKLCNEKSQQIFDLQGVLTHKQPRETCQKGFQ